MWSKFFKRILAASLGAATFQVLALPELCLQAPERSNACPHLLYKKSKQAIPALKVQANAVVCLCLSDLSPLLITTHDALDKIDQQRAWNVLSQKYQLSKEEILTLIQD